MTSLSIPPQDAQDAARADELFQQQWQANLVHTDRMFALLIVVQWIGAIVAALLLTPVSSGASPSVNAQLWLAMLMGGAISFLPLYLALRIPGGRFNRYVIAVSQMLFSSLLIHVTGGRIETHFHVFGSLAFLAFYRDWTVLLPATAVVALDHFVRGTFWPESVFGSAEARPWLWLEHTGWVLFEVVFLIASCRHAVAEMSRGALRQAELERTAEEMRTQKAQSEQAYQTTNAVLSGSLDAVVWTDADGKILAWNEPAERIFGWKADEVMGRTINDLLIPPEHRTAPEMGLRCYIKPGEGHIASQRVEVAAKHRDGRQFPIELTISPIRAGGLLSFCAFMRDLSDRQKTEAALLKAKEEAEAANHAKSAFLANMSHEIRTPLNGILGFASLLLNDIDGDPEERRDFVQTIHDSGRHLLTLIDDVLDLSKIESGQMSIERVRCSPHEIIAETISILRVRAQERGLTLEYFWKGDIPETIESDPARLRQILMNLIGNAIKFTEVGSVQVAARLDRNAPEPMLVIDVIDTGVGIAPENLENIFDPFVQADSSITRRFGGTGLGLSISRRLSRLLGGDLTVNSVLGRGSIFTSTIATGSLEGVSMTQSAGADVVPARRKRSPETPRTLPPCRILVVEDGATNRKLIGLVLERAGAKIQCAENGLAGVEAASWEPFDLILMDMQMPIMDGYTAARELRARNCNVPIIALTAHAMSGDKKKCLDAGCSGYLTKPIDPHRLLEAVAEALNAPPPPPTKVVEETDETPAEDALVSTLPTDDPEFREIVVEFIERLEEKVVALRDAWKANDLREIADIAHWIKGAGGTAGFPDFTEPAGALERMARQGPADRIGQQIHLLESLHRRIVAPVAN